MFQEKRALRVPVTPRYEDAGLFVNEICRLPVLLYPMVSRNRRNDLIITGRVKGDIDIPVLFAGRRVRDAGPLVEFLKSLRPGHGHDDPRATRHPVQIVGAWRARFSEDAYGFATRDYQLVAAQWSYQDKNGRILSFGMQPEK